MRAVGHADGSAHAHAPRQPAAATRRAEQEVPREAQQRRRPRHTACQALDVREVERARREERYVHQCALDTWGRGEERGANVACGQSSVRVQREHRLKDSFHLS